MILRSASASPFVRKVRIAAAILGLDRGIEIVAADTVDPNDTVRQQNPLGKIPALVLDDGAVLYDSRVIVEYLDHLAGGGRVIPTESNARFAALRMQALADGIMDASVLLVYEAALAPIRPNTSRNGSTIRPARSSGRSARWKPRRPGSKRRRTSGQIAVACALGYRRPALRGRVARDASAPRAASRRVRGRRAAYEATRAQL